MRRPVVALFLSISLIARVMCMPHEGSNGTRSLPIVVRKPGSSWTTNTSHQRDRSNTGHRFDCDTHLGHASPTFLSIIGDLYQQSLNGSAVNGSWTSSDERRQAHHLQSRAATITIKVYLHIVTTTQNVGTVSNAQLKAQINVLNSAYYPSGFNFVLAGVSFTLNNGWAVGASSASDIAMKSALRKGSYADLNLYFQTDLAENRLGNCSLPTQIAPGARKSLYVIDGCNIAAGTVPQGSIYGYNKGMTAVHEVGHWLGLLHTFEGYSCTGTGDFIADTAAESTSTEGCPTDPRKNSCQGFRAGYDPIHNYMDYSIDSCYTSFSPGQGTRMRLLWSTLRRGK